MITLQLVDWLLHRIPFSELAACPSMTNSFACMVNATATALTEASASLAERIESAGDATSWESFPGVCTSPVVAERNVRELLQQVSVRKRVRSG